MRRTWLLLVCGLLAACRQHESSPAQATPKEPAKPATSNLGTPIAPGTLKRANVETMYGVAVPAGADLATLEKLAHAKGPKLEVKRTAVPDLFTDHQLAFMTKDLPAADVDALKTSPGVIVLEGSGTNGFTLARDIAGVAHELADAAHGWVLDPETFQIFTAAAFHEHVPTDHPDVRKLIVVHSIVGGNQQPFLDTAGMHRYGFPELYVAEAASGDINQMTHMINAAAQTLIDGGDVNNRGELAFDFRKLGWTMDIIGQGTGKGVWKTRWARERDANEGDELVVELVPLAGEGTEGASKLIADCFGAGPEHIAQIKDDDTEILAAAAHARDDLAKLRAHFAKEIPFDERLTVKAKFTGDDGQVEWMWVDVVAFKGNTLEGTLANEPDAIKSLHNGQKVKVKLGDVGDYLHETKDGKRTGGYAIEVMKKRGLLPSDADY
jgi:uncharacterized protein YegJ (DUF2314 family)